MLKLNNPDLLDNRSPDFIRKVAGILEKTIWPYHRAEVRGMERIPPKNGVVYVGNHNGYPYMPEAFIFTSAIFDQFRMSRYPYILMHDLPLKLPLINQFFTHYGCIRATQQNALRVLEQDEPLLIYPGGAEELMRPHRERTRLRFRGRSGYIRLALKYNKPIVPVVAVGGHSTALILDDLPWLARSIGAKSTLRVGSWPLMLSFPWGLTLGPVIPPYLPWPSKIIIEVLEPIVLAPASSKGVSEQTWFEQCAQRVERTIEDALTRLEAERVSQHGLMQHAQKSAHQFQQWLAQVLKQLGMSVEEFRKRFAVQQTSQSGVMPDPDQVFAELLKRAAVAPQVEPEPKQTNNQEKAARFTEAQIRAIIKQGAGNSSVRSVCRDYQISESTYYRWRTKYGSKKRQATALRA